MGPLEEELVLGTKKLGGDLPSFADFDQAFTHFALVLVTFLKGKGFSPRQYAKLAATLLQTFCHVGVLPVVYSAVFLLVQTPTLLEPLCDSVKVCSTT